MEAVGRLSAGIVHDFNNLLTVIVAGADLVRTRLARGLDVSPQLENIGHATDRATNLTSRLMAFTTAEPHAPKVVDLTALVTGMLGVLERTIEERITLAADLPAVPLWIRADPVEVERAVMNLVINSRDAIDDTGTIRVSVGHGVRSVAARDATQPTAVLTVEDDGRGMTPEVERRIFEPFFTTRSDQGGHGLGLAAVYGLAKLAGGEVTVRSRPGEGARFEVTLPLVPAPEQASPRLRLAPPPARRPTQIMVVEDSEDVRDLVCDVLRDAGYEVTAATDGQEALELFDAGASVGLVISDVVMPRLGGIELTRELRRRTPELPVVLMSGYAPNEAEVPEVPRLHKPFAIDTFLETVRAAIDASETSTHSAKDSSGER